MRRDSLPALLPIAEMPDPLRRRAEQLVSHGAALYVRGETTGDHVLQQIALDAVEDAVALFNEFDAQP